MHISLINNSSITKVIFHERKSLETKANISLCHYQRIILKCFITKVKSNFGDYEAIDILIETITKILLKSLFMKTILTIIIITLFSVLHNLIAVTSLYYQFHVL